VDESGRTWTTTYRGLDDAAIIGAFAREAATGGATGWTPAEQHWDVEDGARVLVVRYERAPGASTTAPASEATGTPDTSLRPERGRTERTPPPRRRARNARRSSFRSALATIGMFVFAAAGIAFLIVDSGTQVSMTCAAIASFGLAAWLLSRILLGVERRAAHAHTVLGSTPGLLACAAVTLGLVAFGLDRLPVVAPVDEGLVITPIEMPTFSFDPFSFDPFSFDSAPVETPAPTVDFGIDDPPDGYVSDSPALALEGHAPPSAPVVCSRGTRSWNRQADDLGQWSVQVSLDPGDNQVTCAIDQAKGSQTLSVSYEQPASSGGTFEISMSGGSEPFVFGPFELTAGAWTASWAVTGKPGCAAHFAVLANPETGFSGSVFSGTAGPDGTANGTRTFAAPATGTYRIWAQVDCDGWSLVMSGEGP
jgi:hypothetical protein